MVLIIIWKSFGELVFSLPLSKAKQSYSAWHVISIPEDSLGLHWSQCKDSCIFTQVEHWPPTGQIQVSPSLVGNIVRIQQTICLEFSASAGKGSLFLLLIFVYSRKRNMRQQCCPLQGKNWKSKVISWLQTESDDKPGKLTQLWWCLVPINSSGLVGLK